MNVSEILGKKIIDKNVRDVGKIAEMTFNKKTFELICVYGSTGNPLTKKYFEIAPDKILALGDYLQVDYNKDDLLASVVDKFQPNEGSIRVSEFKDKKVLDCNGNDSGKVTGIEVDFDNAIITTLNINASVRGKTAEQSIELTDISGLGDYLLLNKEIKFEEETKKEKEAPKDDKDKEEKVTVDIS
ncbi:MAG: hypothetical protein E7Z86_08175 [Methanosphaera stadtmanae]|jgi:sporulation protein YlmC with PRC-barrel domain|nr:hypothetical protein [Methanosphaera stadtmanae]